MQFRLRTLLLWLTLAPFLLATLHWTVMWRLGHRIHPTLWAVLLTTYCLTSLAGPFLLYHELIRLLCGPEAFTPLPRKTKRRTRYRLERYATTSS